jgi:tetratricopeptide (TPR) repeat protein
MLKKLLPYVMVICKTVSTTRGSGWVYGVQGMPRGYCAKSTHPLLRVVLTIICCALLLAGVVRAQQPQTVADHMRAGVAAQRAGKNEEALQHYAAVINLEPKNFGAHLNSGVVHMGRNDWRAAVSAFRVAVEIRPDDAFPNYYLGLAEQQTGNHTASIAPLKRATELQKDWASAYAALGESYEATGDQEKFLASIKEADRLEPDNLVVLNLLGRALRANKKFVEAVEPLKRVVAGRPNDVEALYLLGNTQLMAGTYDDAITTLNQVLVLDPSHSEARERLRVSSLRKTSSLELEKYKQQVAENPKSGKAHAALGQKYNSLGMFAEAQDEYQTAVDLEPKNTDSLNRQCVNYGEWGKTQQGIECYQRLIKLKANHVFYFMLGDLYEQQGKFGEAATAYQNSIELKPAFTFALYGLGHVRIRQGQHAEAIEPLRKLLEVEPKHLHGNHALGLAYVRTGNKTGAMQQYYTLQNLNSRLAAELLEQIPK